MAKSKYIGYHIITTLFNDYQALGFYEDYYGSKVDVHIQTRQFTDDDLIESKVLSLKKALRQGRNKYLIIIHIQSFLSIKHLPFGLADSIIKNCVFIDKDGVEHNSKSKYGFIS